MRSLVRTDSPQAASENEIIANNLLRETLSGIALGSRGEDVTVEQLEREEDPGFGVTDRQDLSEKLLSP